MTNIKNKILQIENQNGDTIMQITVNRQGNIIEFNNCEIADIDNNKIRLQVIEEKGGINYGII